MMPNIVNIIGGGLAGCECALYLSERGVNVRLFEMRPDKQTPVHQTGLLSELVCSNSLKSEMVDNASGMLKHELESLGSVLLKIAHKCRVQAGKALAVDRVLFSQMVTQAVEEKVEIIREEITDISSFGLETESVVVATGPLTSMPLMASLKDVLKSGEMFFFDAISPIVDSDGI